MRLSTVETIYEAALENPDIHFMSGDLGHVKTKEFQKNLRAQYLNAGMAEQNIIGVAAGLALTGKKVFAYSIVPFITLRCLEQIKDDVCNHNIDVTVIGIGGGFAYGNAGATHYSIEDIAALRALPNMKIVCPATPYEAKMLTKEVIRLGGPAYIRLGRGKEPNLEKEYSVEFGKAVVVNLGNDVTIFVSGPIISEALRAAEILEKENISTEVINMHTIKPLNADIVCDRAKKRKMLFTLEEHNVIGGLGSAVAEIVSKIRDPRAPLHCFGVPDKWPKLFGSQQYLREQMGISGELVAEKIKKEIKTL
ncbi:transketolase [bacterium]|nr:transketolase [bacterium]|tara:strand:- start:6129 stop:7052 length:924 start_codon:yes stop_codon:yes gene_type:complete